MDDLLTYIYYFFKFSRLLLKSYGPRAIICPHLVYTFTTSALIKKRKTKISEGETTKNIKIFIFILSKLKKGSQ